MPAIHVLDVARIVMQLVDLPELPPRLIVSNPQQAWPNSGVTIKKLVSELLWSNKAVTDADVVWETDKPNGQRRRPTDTSLLRSLLPDFRFEPLGEALRRSYEWFVANYETARK